MFSSDNESAPSILHKYNSVIPSFSDSMCCSDLVSGSSEGFESSADGLGSFCGAADGDMKRDDSAAHLSQNDETYGDFISDDGGECDFTSDNAVCSGDDFSSNDPANDFASDNDGSDFSADDISDCASDDAKKDFASDDVNDDFASEASDDFESLADEFASLFGSAAGDNDRLPLDVEQKVVTQKNATAELTSATWRLSGSIADSIVRIFLNNPHEGVRKNVLATVGVQNCEELHVRLSTRFHELLKRAQHRSERKRNANRKADIKTELGLE